jgi:hypothetical protein
MASRMTTTRPRPRDLGGQERELALWCVVAVALVLLRSFVATYYEGFHFDSDQAIVGLMARHLSRLQTFPLFYYGLNYMLGVEAWIIAPFFAIGRSSVILARVPFVALNAAVAVWLLRRFTRGTTPLSSRIAFVAALPFILPTPAVSGQLLELAGSCVEPFVYVLLLWTLRQRPFAFGLLLAFAYLHREFTIFALPALLLVEGPDMVRHARIDVRGQVQRAGWTLIGFALTWLVIDDLKMHLIGGGLVGQTASLRGQVCTTGPELWNHVRALTTEALPILYGGRRMPLAAVRMTSPVAAGSSIVGWIVAAALALMAVRLIGLLWPSMSLRQPADASERASGASDGFALYLAVIGFFTACAYPLSCNVTLGAPPLLRYLLLALLLPVGLFAAFMQRERSPVLRAAATAVIVGWASINLWDNVRVVRAAISDPPGSEHRVLVDYLLEHRIRYARAIYWDAYVVDFLSGERVVVASVDVFRIPQYQQQVEAHADTAVNLERLPCDGPTKVASWCITPVP